MVVYVVIGCCVICLWILGVVRYVVMVLYFGVFG